MAVPCCKHSYTPTQEHYLQKKERMEQISTPAPTTAEQVAMAFQIAAQDLGAAEPIGQAGLHLTLHDWTTKRITIAQNFATCFRRISPTNPKYPLTATDVRAHLTLARERIAKLY